MAPPTVVPPKESPSPAQETTLRFLYKTGEIIPVDSKTYDR